MQEFATREGFLDYLKDNQEEKKHIIRFLDIFPLLEEKKESEIKEYLDTNQSLPEISRISSLLQDTFIAGDLQKSLEAIDHLLKKNLTFTFDILCEKTTSDAEADDCVNRYFTVIDVLTKKFGKGAKDTFGNPLINITIKLSSLSYFFDPIAQEGVVKDIRSRLDRIIEKAKEVEAFVYIDVENYQVRDLTNKIFKEIVGDYPYFGLAVQAYLKDSKDVVTDIISWAKDKPITVRLVKGAYWDHEIMEATRNNWPIPVFTSKEETDANYRACAELLLASPLGVAFATHNNKDVQFLLEQKKKHDKKNFEIQMLYGINDKLKEELAAQDICVRVYVPAGTIVQGMAYFIRRIIETSSKESCLRT